MAEEAEVWIDILVHVDYEKDEPFREMVNGKHYPITIKNVVWRGESIMRLLHISHIMMIQRRTYFQELDKLE